MWRREPITIHNGIWFFTANLYTMVNKQDQKKPNTDKESKETDPQEHMEGPVSSIMQNIKEEVEENDEESKEEADAKKDRNT